MAVINPTHNKEKGAGAGPSPFSRRAFLTLLYGKDPQTNPLSLEQGLAAKQPKRPADHATHALSRALAVEVGAEEAALLKHLGWNITNRNHTINGRSWYYDTLDDLQVKLPYLPRSTIHGMIKRLEGQGVLELGDHNRCAYDRTLWFTMPREVLDQAEEDLIYFEVGEAIRRGVPAAVLISNLAYQLVEHQKVTPGVQWHAMKPAMLHELLPFLSVSTIKRLLGKMVQAGVIEKAPTGPFYRFLEGCDTGGSIQDDTGPNLDEEVQIGTSQGQNGTTIPLETLE